MLSLKIYDLHIKEIWLIRYWLLSNLRNILLSKQFKKFKKYLKFFRAQDQWKSAKKYAEIRDETFQKKLILFVQYYWIVKTNPRSQSVGIRAVIVRIFPPADNARFLNNVNHFYLFNAAYLVEPIAQCGIT